MAAVAQQAATSFKRIGPTGPSPANTGNAVCACSQSPFRYWPWRSWQLLLAEEILLSAFVPGHPFPAWRSWQLLPLEKLCCPRLFPLVLLRSKDDGKAEQGQRRA